MDRGIGAPKPKSKAHFHGNNSHAPLGGRALMPSFGSKVFGEHVGELEGSGYTEALATLLLGDQGQYHRGKNH